MGMVGVGDTMLIEAARALAPRIEDCAEQIECKRRLPQPLVDAMAEAGLFRMLVPQVMGGAEADPVTMIRVIEEVARVDGSAGWIVNIGATSGVFAGALPEPAAREIYGADPRAFVAFVAIPGGRATVVDGGYRVTGRWPFASGCLHATWLAGTCSVYDGDAPRLGADGKPESRVLFFPAADCQIFDTWHVSGLCGTGSNDFAVADAFVPAARSMPTNAYGERPCRPGPLYAFGRNVIPIGLAAVPLGIARGALDALVELAGVKVRRGATAPLRERESFQAQVGLAEAQLGAARAYLCEAVREAMDGAARTGSTTVAQRGQVRLAAAHAAAQAAQVVDLVWTAAGATAIAAGGPFARRLRDVHAARQNVTISAAGYEAVGRVLLGFDPPALWA